MYDLCCGEGGVAQVAGHGRGTLEKWRQAMGYPGMSKYGLSQAVPYAYVAYILTWFKAQFNTAG